MIRYSKLPKNILELLPRAAEYLESHRRVVFAYLFGGLAGGSAAPLSDVDIAVFLSDAARASADKLEILGNLTDILQTDEIDLVVLNTAELPLVMNALKKRRLIVDKDAFARHRFESLTMRKYFDFSIKESSVLRRRYLHGR
jgi:predicted nucleotidyltransferase